MKGYGREDELIRPLPYDIDATSVESITVRLDRKIILW